MKHRTTLVTTTPYADLLESTNEGSSSSHLGEYVVDRYLDNPLLINGLKFDLRLYVAVTSFNPLRIYIHEEGLARFATETYAPFDSGNAHNQFMHLTNYSINKLNVSSGPDPESDQQTHTKWVLSQLWQVLEQRGVDTKALWGRIEDLVIKTFCTVEHKIRKACEQHVPHDVNCFELFGFDVLIDDLLKPWLLEVCM